MPLGRISPAWNPSFSLPKLLLFFSPIWLLFLVGLLIFSPLLDGGTTHIAVMIIRLIVLVVMSVYLVKGIRAGTLVWPSLRIGWAILAFLGLAAVSTAISPYTHQSFQWLIVLLSYAALLYLLVCFLEEWDHIVKLLLVLVGMGLFEAGWAVVQAGWFGVTRPSGTFFNPNFLAGYLATSWVIVLAHLCYARMSRAWWQRERQRRLVRLTIPIATLVVLLTAIAWTGSRGGVLALLVGTLLVVGVRFGRNGLGSLLLVVLIGLLVPNPLRDRLWAEHVTNPVGYARWQIWHSSISAIVEHPLGHGLGLYQYVYPRYAFPIEGQIARYGKVAQTAHNEYLQMGVELGVVSIPIFCWGVVMVLRESALALRQRLRRWQRGTVVGVSAGIAVILAQAAVDSNLHEPALAIVLTLCVGVLISARRLSQRVAEPWRTVPVLSRVAWYSLTVAVVGVLTMAVVRLGLPWIAFEAGSRAAARQDFTRAIADYRIALALDSGKARYHSALAAAYFQIFERTRDGATAQAAVSALQSAISLNPLDGRLSGLLGHVYVSLSSSFSPQDPSSEQRLVWLRSALWAYERAAELEPFSPFYRLELGRLYLALGDRQRAEASVRRAVEIEPNFLQGREWLARLYLDSEQIPEPERIEVATREYREILERQQRYVDWTKDAMEKQILAVDVTALEAALERVKQGA